MEYKNIAIEAAEWFFKLEEDPAMHSNAEFVAWLKRSPQHMGEFLFATAAYKLVSGGDPQRLLKVEDLTGIGAHNIVTLKPPTDSAGAHHSRRKLGFALAAAMAPITVGMLGWHFLPPGNITASTYRTQIGEQRTFQLEDGSILYLNTQSRAKTAYSKVVREIQLLEGEALFVVARDSARPFRVRAGTALVQAVGTQFNIYLRRDSTTVSVVEGRVKISADRIALPKSGSAGPNSAAAKTPGDALLTAGDEARVSRERRISTRSALDVAHAIAWRQRRLVFEATPLSSVAEEFNRYNRLRIRIEDHSAEAIQLTGVFNADEPQALVSFLVQNPGLEVVNTTDEIVIRSRP